MRRRHIIPTALVATAATLTPPGPGGPATVTGKFKNFYNRGTARGTFAMTIATTDMINITYTGMVKHTSGTGKFKQVKGGGSIQCTTSDGGAHKSCTVNSTLAGI